MISLKRNRKTGELVKAIGITSQNGKFINLIKIMTCP